jgi:hypothetical protein
MPDGVNSFIVDKNVLDTIAFGAQLQHVIHIVPVARASAIRPLYARCCDDSGQNGISANSTTGGNASDRDVRHTVERETLEETGLIVDRIPGEFDELYWNSPRGHKNIQLNYVASVKPDMRIKLNPDEHSDWLWVPEEQIDTLLMTPAMRKVLKDAFLFAKKYISL